MSGVSERVRDGVRWRMLLAAAVVLMALLLVVPGRARADGWKACVDGAFVDYNTCLMISTSWFERKLCDLDWEFDVALCTARAVGGIRNAWNGR